MKILHVCNYNEGKWAKRFYSPDRKITNGLIRNGHYVHVFSYRDIARSLGFFSHKKFGARKMNLKLIESAINLRPDLIILGHTELVSSTTLENIRKYLPDVRISMWYVDPMSHVEKINEIKKKLPFLNAFFATTAGKKLQGLKVYNRECVFSFFPNMVDPSIETGRAFRSTCDHDLIYVAGSTPEREKIARDILSEYPNLRTCFRGLCGNPGVDGADFIDLMSFSKMGLNYSRITSDYMYSSDRITQLMGNGVAVLTPKTPGMDELYDPENLVFYESKEDLFELISTLFNDDSLRRKYGESGWSVSRDFYNSKVVTDYLVKSSLGENVKCRWDKETY